MLKIACLLLALLVATSSGQQKRYDGDKVFRLIPNNGNQLRVINRFLDASSDQFDFWRMPSAIGRPVDLRVSAKSLQMFTGLMNVTNVPNWVLVEDVQKMIDDVKAKDSEIVRDTSRAVTIVGTFPSHSATNQWIMSLCAANPSLATCGDIGQSYENRTLKYIKLGKPATPGNVKPKIWIEGTMHAREWISTATVVYLIDRLFNSYEKDPVSKRMLDTYDWWVIPISNPDGYEYTRNKERLWRKTRSKVSDYCNGVDPNRNWNFRWGQTGGSSTQPCSDTYQGPKPFSEVETKAMSDFMLANRANSLAYFSLHSYSQFWLVPYGVDPRPDDFDELLRVAKIGTNALQAVNKKIWKVGNVIDVIYPASGISADWAKGVAGIKYCYALELRPSSDTINGFVPSASEIDPSGREVWAGLTAALDAIPN